MTAIDSSGTYLVESSRGGGGVGWGEMGHSVAWGTWMARNGIGWGRLGWRVERRQQRYEVIGSRVRSVSSQRFERSGVRGVTVTTMM